MPLRFLIVILFLLLGSLPASALDRAAVEQQFQQWLQQEVWPRAKAEGVSRQVFDQAFDGVRLNWKLPDLVPPGTQASTPKLQSQAEFGSPGKYFARNTVDGATSIGRAMAKQHTATLAEIEGKTGVPARIILAIWGRESGYGRVKIPHDAFEVLGTKGFMSTRAGYFSEELIAALRIAEAGHVAPRAMRSSWAGALGQPQFMPSNFLAHAADGDGDGRVDIWESQADTMASIGNYLQEHGWVSGRDWGFEVSVPDSVSCSLEGPDQGKKIHQWAALGVTRISGRPFPKEESEEEGFLLMPAGRHGPAFIVTPNFYVLKDYNMSDLYALFVGHVGDRIQFGVGDFRAPWEKIGGLYRSDVAAIQRALVEQGHDVGGVDGLAGYKTRRSIGRWQESNNFAPSCFPDEDMRFLLVGK